ncbi:MAG: glycosyltransferase family 4 protein [Nitrososphaerota archaeon]|nr:glycosyltransferase family 4 protein [Nitrososphaerota archaeon]MDG7051707.1 glycosyltransferase family 4 protein [Nitrososphaerota archaeon]
MTRRVLLVTEIDPLTGKVKTGPAMRLRYPPTGYKYTVMVDRLSYTSHVRNYEFNSMTAFYMLLKVIMQRLMVVDEREHDLVHSFFWTMYGYKLPWIHENDQSPSQLLLNYTNLNRPFSQWAARRFADSLNRDNCKAVVVWSRWARNGFIGDGVERQKVRVINVPMSLPTLTPNNIKRSGLKVVFVGREPLRKGGDIAIRAFERLHADFNDTRLIYVGKLPLLRSKPDWMIHYQEVSRPLLEKIYQDGDVFFLPTRSEAYGLGIVEAMSHGMPVVASSIASIPEIVEDGKSGYLAMDLDGYISALEKLLEDPHRRETMGKNGAEKVRREHDPSKIAEEVRALYESI